MKNIFADVNFISKSLLDKMLLYFKYWIRTTNLEALIILELSPFAQTKQTIAHAQTQNHYVYCNVQIDCFIVNYCFFQAFVFSGVNYFLPAFVFSSQVFLLDFRNFWCPFFFQICVFSYVKTRICPRLHCLFYIGKCFSIRLFVNQLSLTPVYTFPNTRVSSTNN
jgi:hypothetical protein